MLSQKFVKQAQRVIPISLSVLKLNKAILQFAETLDRKIGPRLQPPGISW